MLFALMVLCLMRPFISRDYMVSMPYASLYLPGLYAVSFDLPEL